jgi:hypothetical protein
VVRDYKLIRPFPIILLDFPEEITDLYTMVQICSNPESDTKLPPQRENRLRVSHETLNV